MGIVCPVGIVSKKLCVNLPWYLRHCHIVNYVESLNPCVGAGGGWVVVDMLILHSVQNNEEK